MKKGKKSMYNYICNECHGYCDAGELINGICNECREEKKMYIDVQDNNENLLNAPFKHMALVPLSNKYD